MSEITSKKIRSAELESGMYVIVAKWLDEALLPAIGSREWQEMDPRSRVYKPVGDPLKVLSVALPFFTVEVCQNGVRGVLDSRLMEIMQVDLKYARSLVPSYGKKKQTPKRHENFDERKIFNASKGVWETILEPKR